MMADYTDNQKRLARQTKALQHYDDMFALENDEGKRSDALDIADELWEDAEKVLSDKQLESFGNELGNLHFDSAYDLLEENGYGL